MRTLVETGALVGERGAYRLARAAPDASQVPATVQAILAARIDRLAARGQAPAPVGRGHRQGRAVRAAPGDRRAAGGRRSAAGLARLQAAEFLYETSLFPDLEYTFKHALTHEVAYGSLLQERRRALHARIVEAHRARSTPTALAEQVERLAHHAVRGRAVGEGGRLPPPGRRQGARALGQPGGGGAASSRHWPRSAHLPETEVWLAATIDLHLDVCTVLFHTGAPESHRAHLRDAEELATQLGDRHRLGWVSSISVASWGWPGRRRRSSRVRSGP